MNYESVKQIESAICAGVTFTVARMSFIRRMELMRKVRDLAAHKEFLEAGDAAKDKMEAALVHAEIEKLYVAWGLKAIAGLELDGAPATPGTLAESGPEELFHEAARLVRSECGLNETERKN